MPGMSKTPHKIPSFVFDSYAILCYIQDENGAEKVSNLLQQAINGDVQLMITWVNLGEVYYRLYRTHGETKANEVLAVIKNWPLTVLQVDESLTITAATVKAKHSLSYADAYVIAAALKNEAVLVTGDHEIEEAKRNLPFTLLWLGDDNG